MFGLKAVKLARVNWFFCASFSIFYFELPKLKVNLTEVTLAVSSLVFYLFILPYLIKKKINLNNKLLNFVLSTSD